MRAGFVTSVAANSITPSSSAANIATPIAAASGDDGFAAILGGTCATPASDTAANSNTAADNGSVAASSTDNSTTPSAANQSPDSATLALQEIQSGDGKPAPLDAATPSQPVDPKAAQDSSDPFATAFSATQDARDAVSAKPGSRDAVAGSARHAGGAKPQPAQIPVDGSATPSQDGPPDSIAAQLLAAQQATPATNSPVPKASADASGQSDAVSDPLAAPVSTPTSTDVAATAILTGGATVKPGKYDSTDAKAPADSEKSQTQASTAAALADLGKPRVFTDQRASTAHALPIHAAADQPKNDSQSGDSPSGQQNPGSAPNSAPVAAATDTGANSVVAPTHVQAAAPDAAAPANAAAVTTAPAATAAATAPAQVSAQLHIAHQTAAPDINSLAFNIASKSEGGARHFDIRLDPAELGRVDVRLTVDDAGKAQASLSVEKPQTLELLQKDQSHLARALKDAGLDLSQNGLSFSLKGQQQQAGGNAATPRGRSHAMRAIAAVGETASTLSQGSAASSDTRLDIRV